MNTVLYRIHIVCYSNLVRNQTTRASPHGHGDTAAARSRRASAFSRGRATLSPSRAHRKIG